LFQAATLADKTPSVDLSHRFMFEQRWIGRYSNPSLDREDEFKLSYRFRYMLRIQIPFKGKEIVDKTPFIVLYDEIFIGFGKNVNENIFDQNRIGVLIGYKFNQLLRIEAGYLSQIIQLGREINSSNVFQYNNGIIVNLYFNLDLTKQK
jgi:hypothetical protein